jgi:hypothetical protein
MIELCPERESFVMARYKQMVFKESGGWSKGKDEWWILKGDREWEMGALQGVGAVEEIAGRKGVRTRKHQAW